MGFIMVKSTTSTNSHLLYFLLSVWSHRKAYSSEHKAESHSTLRAGGHKKVFLFYSRPSSPLSWEQGKSAGLPRAERMLFTSPSSVKRAFWSICPLAANQLKTLPEDSRLWNSILHMHNIDTLTQVGFMEDITEINPHGCSRNGMHQVYSICTGATLLACIHHFGYSLFVPFIQSMTQLWSNILEQNNLM